MFFAAKEVLNKQILSNKTFFSNYKTPKSVLKFCNLHGAAIDWIEGIPILGSTKLLL
jgi:hypothetical protein